MQREPRHLMFVSPSAYPMGGVATWLNYLLPGLQSKGFTCTLALASGLHHDPRSYVARNPWVDVVSLENPTGSSFGRIHAVANTISKCKPDVVVSVNIAALADAIAHLRHRGRPTPRLVMSLHGLQADLLADVARNTGVLDGVISTNRLSTQLAGQRLEDRSRAFYAAYGVTGAGSTIAASSGQPGFRSLRLLYVGRLEEKQKRIVDLVRIMRRARHLGQRFTLTVAGSGPDETLLREATLRENLASEIRLIGELTAAQVRDEYSRHDVLLLTSTWETGPIVIWEAMAQGLPILTSAYVGSGLEGALEHDRNCLMFPVGDIDSAVLQLKRLMSPELRARLSAAGASMVGRRYSMDSSVEAWASAFQQVLRLPPLPRPGQASKIGPAGRLDLLLGVALAERARRCVGVQFAHKGAGAEWPHTNCGGADEDGFLSGAAIVDRGGPAPLFERRNHSIQSSLQLDGQT
jgi:glycosyltransferase involved in cell wall biosynthesis